MSEPTEVIVNDPDWQTIAEMVNRLEDGNGTKRDVKALTHALADSENLWRASGDMATVATSRLIQNAAGKNKFMSLSMARGCEVIKERLGYDESPMLEQLLIDAVVLAWLRLGLVEYWHTKYLEDAHTHATGDYWDRRLSAAQRRFLRAIQSLARVRKMDLPALQINLAEQQVNIVGGA